MAVNRRTRFLVLKRDKYTCQLCGKTQADGVKLEIDHKHPRSKGGDDTTSNLWTLCYDCNRGKYSLLTGETPTEPTALTIIEGEAIEPLRKENPLRYWREKRGKTIAELAPIAWVRHDFIVQYERGIDTMPSRDVLFLAYALNVDYLEFVTNQEQAEELEYIVTQDKALKAEGFYPMTSLWEETKLPFETLLALVEKGYIKSKVVTLTRPKEYQREYYCLDDARRLVELIRILNGKSK